MREETNGTGTDMQVWEPMQLRYVGRVAEIVQQGGGKLSVTGGDPGESRKQRGGESNPGGGGGGGGGGGRGNGRP